MLWLRLDANAVRPLHIATHNGPHDTTCEHETSEVSDECVCLVHAAVQELQRFGQLVVNLKCRGDTKQHKEAEVDHRVHEARCAVTQQRAHVHTRAVISQTALHVLRCRLSTIGRTALPVTHTVGEAERTPHQHHGDDRVERSLQRAWNALKHMACDVRFAVPLGEIRNDAGHQGEHTHEESDAD